MVTTIARFISTLFNPFIITTCFLLITLNSRFYFALAIPEKVKWMIIGLVFITTFLLPLMINGIINSVIRKSMKADAGDERRIQLMLASVFYFLTYYLLGSVKFSPVFNLYIMGACILATMVLVINIYWKISVFMTSCGALTGAFTGISLASNSSLLMLIIFSLIISGITGFSRLKLQTHSPAQVYSGFGLGALFMTMIFLIF